MEKKLNLIALDMDGVVNSSIAIYDWFDKKMSELENNGFSYLDNEIRLEARKIFNKEFENSTELIFPELAQRIKRIVDETDCYILWISTWRKLEKYSNIEIAKDMFNRRGLPGDKLLDYTPSIGMAWSGSCRGNEIKMWINNNTYGKVNKCAVIDDREDAGYNLPSCAKFFQINEQIGITEYDMEDIINYLKEK